MRIVPLFPSATEMICALGLEDELVGAPTSAISRRSSADCRRSRPC